MVGQDRHLHLEQRCAHGGAEQRLIARVVGVRHHRHTAGQQLGAGGLDQQVFATVGGVERKLVVRAGNLAVLHFRLGDGGALVDVVQRGCVLLVGLAAGQVAQERALADRAGAVADGGVEQRPVDRQAEATEQVLERLLVEVRDLAAQLHEVGAADGNGAVVLGHVAVERRSEGGILRQRRIATHTGEVLHAALGGQTVVVPTDGVEHGLAGHPLEAGDGVGVRVAEHVADVQRAAHRWRGSVDREHAVPGGRAVEAVGGVGLPLLHPAVLDTVQ
ncbi:unannotated protein [freshwater metagenome]|uniref:Unannotated protein n=1 Tax=freshwater metagenome TaxID=449393 RepID=A0A6J6ZME5_9ZZZZ